MKKCFPKNLIGFRKNVLFSAKIFCCIMMLSIFLISYGCSKAGNKSKEPPKVNIVIDKQNIDYTIIKNSWDGITYKNDKSYFAELEDDPFTSQSFFDFKDIVDIEFEVDVPDYIKVYDSILDVNGYLKYSESATSEISYTMNLDEKSLCFEINRNIAASFSSDSKDYLPGKTLRGIKLVCRWGSASVYNECEYRFIIRTNAE